MKRYAVFAYPQYYPGGGWDDLFGLYESKGKARAGAMRVKGMDRDNIQLVDLETGEFIETL